MSDNYKTVRLAASHLRRASRMLNLIIKARGDQDGQIAQVIKEQDTTASALDVCAMDLRPSLAIKKWCDGTAAAAKNYRPGKTVSPA